MYVITFGSPSSEYLPLTKFNLPIPCFEGITGPFKQIALHHQSVGRIHVKLQLWIVIRKVLNDKTIVER